MRTQKPPSMILFAAVHKNNSIAPVNARDFYSFIFVRPYVPGINQTQKRVYAKLLPIFRIFFKTGMLLTACQWLANGLLPAQKFN